MSQSSVSSPNQKPRPSASGSTVEKELSSYEEVTASQIVTGLLRLHGKDYAKGRGRSLRLSIDSSIIDRMPVTEWIEAVRSLYEQSKVEELHGRLVILGLSILDWDLAKELSANDFLKSLQEEVKEEFTSLLTSNANRTWHSMPDYLKRQDNVDTVPTYLDHPTKADELGRKVFAQILAQRIRIIHDEEIKADENSVKANGKGSSIQGEWGRGPEVKKREGAFTVLIHGPWGSGKSSLLNFLSDELKRGEGASQWVVVNFNAWQHQRLGRPWWWLMNAVFQQGAEQLSKEDNRIEEQYVRKLAARRLAAPEVATRTEHALRNFASLLEPNPRAMKRLVNAYGVQRAIAMLVGENPVIEQLALWTIIVLRWPILAEYLEEQPAMVIHIGGTLQDKVPERLRELFQDEEVRDVIRGKGVGISLDENTIRSCAYLRTSVQPH